MKTQLLKIAIFLFSLSPSLLLAQSPADKLFDKYAGEDGFTSVYITKHMFNLFANVETEDDKDEFVKLVKNLECIKILSLEKDSTQTKPKVNFYDEIMVKFPKDQYEELMVVKKKDQDIKFLIRKEGEKIKEFLMVIGGLENNALISIQGDIDLASISKLSKSLDIDGMENLEEIEEEK
jgi:hypothetical protein